MGLFSFTQEIAIDLGTANTVIIHNDKIVVDEPSVSTSNSNSNTNLRWLRWINVRTSCWRSVKKLV